MLDLLGLLHRLAQFIVGEHIVAVEIYTVHTNPFAFVELYSGICAPVFPERILQYVESNFGRKKSAFYISVLYVVLYRLYQVFAYLGVRRKVQIGLKIVLKRLVHAYELYSGKRFALLDPYFEKHLVILDPVHVNVHIVEHPITPQPA